MCKLSLDSSSSANCRNVSPTRVAAAAVAADAAVPTIGVAPVLFAAAAETVVVETSSAASSAGAAAAVASLVGTAAASSYEVPHGFVLA